MLRTQVVVSITQSVFLLYHKSISQRSESLVATLLLGPLPFALWNSDCVHIQSLRRADMGGPRLREEEQNNEAASYTVTIASIARLPALRRPGACLHRPNNDCVSAIGAAKDPLGVFAAFPSKSRQ